MLILEQDFGLNLIFIGHLLIDFFKLGLFNRELLDLGFELFDVCLLIFLLGNSLDFGLFGLRLVNPFVFVGYFGLLQQLIDWLCFGPEDVIAGLGWLFRQGTSALDWAT